VLGIQISVAKINENKNISGQVKSSDPTRMSRNKTGGAPTRQKKIEIIVI